MSGLLLLTNNSDCIHVSCPALLKHVIRSSTNGKGVKPKGSGMTLKLYTAMFILYRKVQNSHGSLNIYTNCGRHMAFPKSILHTTSLQYILLVKQLVY